MPILLTQAQRDSGYITELQKGQNLDSNYVNRLNKHYLLNIAPKRKFTCSCYLYNLIYLIHFDNKQD